MDLNDIANEIFAVLESGRQIAPFSAVYPDFGLNEAYRITAAVRAEREARGERPIGSSPRLYLALRRRPRPA